MGSEPHNPYGAWRSPESAIEIEYRPEVMEEIRRAVVEAFYAFPHGGAEIGGLLLGSHRGGLVRIEGHRAVECEHAFGPSFRLSSKDLVKAGAMMAEISLAGERVVGWYHSHTRSEILLSPQDMEIHQRWCDATWQVALVLRPTHMVTRAGFFARGADGEFRTEASHGEFVVPVLAARPMVKTETPSPAPVPVEPPSFGSMAPAEPRRLPWRALLGVAVLAALIFLIGTTRERWSAWLPAPAPGTASLNVYDQDGTLQINWDWRSRAVRQARTGTLEIVDGALQPTIPLAPERLKTGNVSYQRQSARVDVCLRLQREDGRRSEEHLTFLGKLPPAHPTPFELELQQLRTDLIREKMLNEALERELRAAKHGQTVKSNP